MTDPKSQGATPAQYAKQWTYTGNGNVQTVTDGLGRVTTNTWDTTTGLLDSVGDASGRVTSYDYNFAGEATSQSSSKGATSDPATSFTYDEAGRPTSATVTGMGTATRVYNSAGDLIEATEPDGRITRYHYDAAGRRDRVTYPDGRTFTLAYDTLGRVGTITPGETLADTFTGTDGAGIDPAKWVFVTGTKIQDNKAKMTLTATNSDAMAMAFADIGPDQSAAVTYTFADNTNPQILGLAVRRAGSGGYAVRIDSTSATAHIAKLDGSGAATNLVSFSVPVDTEPHRVRLQAVGTTISARVWDPADPEPSTWDATTTDSGFANGFVTLTDEQVGTADVSVTLDDFTAGNPTTPLGPVATYSYDADGRPIQADLTGGVQRSRSYADGHLVSYGQTGIGAAVADSISYDSVGRPVSINSGARTFTYDLADQLIGETSGGVSSEYSYDANGNRATLDQGSLDLSYSYDDAGQLTGIDDGSVFSYDGAGRRLTASGPGYSTSYAYDNAGRLVDLERTEGQTTTSETRSYAPFGTLDRISDTTGASTTSTRLDRDPTTSPGELLAVTTNTTTSDLIGVGDPDVTATGGTTAPVGFDVFDSVTSTPSGASLPACAATYDAWGVPTTGTASTTKPCVGYRNQLGVNAHYYAHARNYTPTLGAFTTPDPAQGQPGTPTLTATYPYANNNPITNTDPTGMSAVGDQPFKRWGPARPSRLHFTFPVEQSKQWLGEIEIAGFIPQAETSPVGHLPGPRAFDGDGRGFTDPGESIDPDRNRFYAQLNFTNGQGYAQVNPTCRTTREGFFLGGGCASAWPIILDDHGFLNPFSSEYHKNYFSLGRSGDTLRFRWSVTHADRGWAQDVVRPRVNGELYLAFTHDDSVMEPRWTGDCFPSLEVMRVANGTTEVLGRVADTGWESMTGAARIVKRLYGGRC